MQIKKIKKLKEEGLAVDVKTSVNGGSFEGTFSIEQKPAPSLEEGIEELKTEVIEICELNKKDNIKISGISFSYHGEEQTQGAIITFQKTLTNDTAVININSPLKYIEAVSENTAESQIMSLSMAAIMEKLTEDIKEYVQGFREQIDLFK